MIMAKASGDNTTVAARPVGDTVSTVSAAEVVDTSAASDILWYRVASHYFDKAVAGSRIPKNLRHADGDFCATPQDELSSHGSSMSAGTG